MARDISTIQQSMLDAAAADDVLASQMTSTSKRAIYRLWTFIVATACGVMEQLWDAFQADTELAISKAPPGSPAWLQDQVFKFQYSATSPQVIQLINFAPQYPIVDPTLRIITRCSVTTDISNNVTIKVATGDTPGPLDGPQLVALSSYINAIGVAGPTYNTISNDADRLYLQADIYYKGLFSSVIKSNVILAIANYLAGIPFNGRIKVSDLELAIKAVTGVEDVVFKNVVARANATAFGSGTALISNNSVASRYWPTLAGYAISEDTAGQTLSDTLNFISE